MNDEELNEDLVQQGDDGEIPFSDNEGLEPDSDLPDDWDRADHEQQYGGGLKRIRQPDRMW